MFYTKAIAIGRHLQQKKSRVISFSKFNCVCFRERKGTMDRNKFLKFLIISFCQATPGNVYVSLALSLHRFLL